MEIALERRKKVLGDYFHLQAAPFWVLHAGLVAGLFVWGWSWSGFALAVALYYVRMFFVTGVYHRYFSHRAYKTSRWFQFVIALLGGMSVQKGALWWAGHHRHHHKFSDKPEDLHSPRQDGTLWAHVGWIVAKDHNETRYDLIRDFAKYPELVWLNKYHLVPVALYALALNLTLGVQGWFWGFVVSTVLLWHGTFTINSLSHVYGNRRYETEDDSRNNWLLALLTMGEGWHNNHHHYQSTANQGFYWWEVDLSYYVLWTLSRVGLVWDLRKPPERVLEEGRRRPKEVSTVALEPTSVAPDAAA
ncbi:MAG TPA: acyl-CoA desaturase [Polyangiales bacterium]